VADILGIAPVVVRRSRAQLRRFPRLKVGASLAALFGLVGDAFKMAYVDPYIGHGRRPPVVPDDDLEGRDPTW
jgi:hypothetical protein